MLGVLNVGAGDTKLSFDKNNPQERIRAARIVAFMLKRGFALLIEVDDGKGGKTTKRVQSFDEEACEYIIADFDPLVAQAVDQEDRAIPKLKEETNVEGKAEGPAEGPAAESKKRRAGTRKVPAERTRGVAVAPIAGG